MGEWSSSYTGHFTSRDRSLGTTLPPGTDPSVPLAFQTRKSAIKTGLDGNQLSRYIDKGCRLDKWGIGVRFAAGGRRFMSSSECPDGLCSPPSTFHPHSTSEEILSPQIKRQEHEAKHLTPCGVKEWMELRLHSFVGCTGKKLCFSVIIIIIIIIQRETRNMKDSIAEKTKERWHRKRMHGQLPRNLDEKLVDTEQSYRW